MLDVVVVGAGAAGVGIGVALRHAGIDKFVMLDRHTVGASFDRWPAQTRFITPSFPTNSIGMLDLNAVALGTSPAFSLEVEHPTGPQYAAYLKVVAGFFELPVIDNTEVLRVTKSEDFFLVETPDGSVRTRHVVWAAGEFLYPSLHPFPGAELCRHTATIPTYDQVEGDDIVVIGGYESGVDVAYNLALRARRVRLLDEGQPWAAETADPSIALSTYSLERMRCPAFLEMVNLHPNTRVTEVRRVGSEYEVLSADGTSMKTSHPPLFAGGFEGSHCRVENLFEKRTDGMPLLSDSDESTITPGIFLCGASVRHEGHVFCFIYKYRQRFAVVAKAIANSLGIPAEGLETYRDWGMYLDDLSCCGEECVC